MTSDIKPAVGPMEGSGFYNRHSSLQAAGIAAAVVEMGRASLLSEQELLRITIPTGARARWPKSKRLSRIAATSRDWNSNTPNSRKRVTRSGVGFSKLATLGSWASPGRI
jgi:hypothetical protein